MLTHLVEHAAFACKDSTGLDGEFVNQDVAFDSCGSIEREELLDREVAVDGTNNIGIDTEDIAVDNATIADNEFTIELDVAFESAVKAEVARGGDVALDKGTSGDDVDLVAFYFHCSG